MTYGAIDPSQYRNVLDTLHTESDKNAIDELEPNLLPRSLLPKLLSRVDIGPPLPNYVLGSPI